jgi:hypothetical protein
MSLTGPKKFRIFCLRCNWERWPWFSDRDLWGQYSACPACGGPTDGLEKK